MKQISKTFNRVASVLAVSAIAFSSLVSGVSATSPADAWSSSSIYSTTVASPTVNPFRSKLDATTAGRVDQIVLKILARGETLPKEQYAAYLGRVSAGMKALSQKPEYSTNTAILDIVGYIDFEVTSIKNKLSKDQAFLDELLNVVDDSTTSGSQTGSTVGTGAVVTSTPRKMVICIQNGKNVSMPVVDLPVNMGADAESKANWYQRYLSCNQVSREDKAEYETQYSMLPGFNNSLDGLLNKTDGMRDWERNNYVTIDYGYDRFGAIRKISGIQYDDDEEKTNNDPHGCGANAWWSDEEKSCVGYYLAFNRTDVGAEGGVASDAYMLNWGTAGMDSCLASGSWSGSKPTYGNVRNVAPAAGSQTYTLTCKGKVFKMGRYVDIFVTKSVTLDPRPKILSVTLTNPSADSPRVTYISRGGSATVSWTSQNSDSCRLMGGSLTHDNVVPANGSFTIRNPDASYNYTLQCSGAGGETQVRYFSVNVQ